MRMINAVMQIGAFRKQLKGHITNDIYNYKHEVIGYEINVGEGRIENILIKDYKIDIRKVAVL
jgi:hypothetical protein